MKNAVIALLSLFLIFFILQSLGAFHYGSGIDRNHRAHFVNKRVDAVENAPHWLLGTSHLEGNPISEGVLAGMRCAVDMLNARGGELGKPFRLEVRAVDTDQESHRQAVQFFCDIPHAAAWLGPTHTRSVPSVRALSQFQGLPCISSLTPSDPLWPRLKPDNHVSLYPSLALWGSSIADALAQSEHRKILLISPDQGSYGWLFANACEQEIRTRLPQTEVFRFNYTAPLASEEVRQALLLYTENRGLDAIVFAGEVDDVLVCARTIRQMRLRLPIYGSDLLDIPDMAAMPADARLPLFVPSCTLPVPSEDFLRAWHDAHGNSPPSIWNILGAQAVLLTARAIREEQGYHPDRLVERVRGLVTRLWREQPPEVRISSRQAGDNP